MLHRALSYLAPLAVTLVLAFSPPAANRDSVARRQVAPGVELIQEIRSGPDGPLAIHCLRVDLNTPGLRVESALGRDVVITDEPAKGREAVGALAARRGAVAAINGDFFPYTGKPLGVAIRDGELISEGLPYRAVMGFTAEGAAIFDNLLAVGTLTAPDGATSELSGINRSPGKDEAVLLTPTYGTKTRCEADAVIFRIDQANLPVTAGRELAGTISAGVAAAPDPGIPPGAAMLAARGQAADWIRQRLPPGSQLRARMDFVPNSLLPGSFRGQLASRAGEFRGRSYKPVWMDVRQAIGGGPWLVRNGAAAVDGQEEGFSPNQFVSRRHPRSAAGVTRDGVLLLVAVDGRQEFSRGISLPDLAQLMIRLGAFNAINLDGGGSTSLVADGAYVNGPSDGEPSAVANALLVFSGQPNSPQTDTNLDTVTIRAGEKALLRLPETASGASAASSATGNALWGTEDGRAFVDQSGVLTGTRAGSGVVLARKGQQVLRIPYRIEPGAPERIRASFAQAANNPPDRNLLNIAVIDRYGNAIPSQTVRIRVRGGQAERDLIATDDSGRATLEVVWDVDTGRQAAITAGTLSPLTLTTRKP